MRAVNAVSFEAVQDTASEIILPHTADEHRAAAESCRRVNADGWGSARIRALEYPGFIKRYIFMIPHDLNKNFPHDQNVSHCNPSL